MKSARSFQPEGRGPFRVDQLRPGDPYELSDGHAIVSEPAGRRHSRRNLTGGALIDSDPAVEEAGVDAGYALGESTLRAPDVSVGGLDDEPGFAVGPPALAIEYAERGGDERALQRKVAELLAAGTRLVWVVRLAGDRLVEVHRPGEDVTAKRSGEDLLAPGILRNPVPVDALYDRAAAHELTLRNLLQRRGYESLEALRAAALAEGRAEGKAQGRAEGRAEGRAAGRAEGRAEGRARGLAEGLAQARTLLRRMLELRGIPIGPDDDAAIDACDDLRTLGQWLERALVAATGAEIFRPR